MKHSHILKYFVLYVVISSTTKSTQKYHHFLGLKTRKNLEKSRFSVERQTGLEPVPSFLKVQYFQGFQALKFFQVPPNLPFSTTNILYILFNSILCFFFAFLLMLFLTLLCSFFTLPFLCFQTMTSTIFTNILCLVVS